MMFEVGDRVFYPIYGVCIIGAVQSEEESGTVQTRFVAEVPNKNMRVTFPAEKIKSLGIRSIVDGSRVDDILATFFDGESDAITNDGQRYKRNMLKLKSGDIAEGVEVIRDLVRIRRKKKLGPMDQQMLDNAQQILTAEVAFAKGISEQQAAILIEQVLNAQ